jgi:hypothetical protein
MKTEPNPNPTKKMKMKKKMWRLMLMVTEIPSISEIFGRSDDSFEIDNIPVDEGMTTDEELMYVAIFVILTSLYTGFEHKSVDYVLNKFPKAATNAGIKIDKTSKAELVKIVETHRVEILKEYKIHEKIIPQVKLDYNLQGTYSTLSSSVKAMINQLKDDVKTKALAAKERMSEAKDFNLKSNFVRAAKRTRNFVKFNAQFAKQKVTRAAQKMRYGSRMLYYWVVAFQNTCKWCFALARLPPKPIDEWPYDHPNGHCVLVPVSNDSSEEYSRYLEMSNNITII